MRYVEVAKSLYDYEARTEDELTVKEDDILYVIDKEDEDWWKAELKQPNAEEQGPIGLVPASYLEEIAPIGKVRAEYDYEAQQEEELSFNEGAEMDLLENDDPDWYLVKLSDGQIGLAPSNYLQMEGDHLEDTEEQYEPQAPVAPPLPPVQPSIPTTNPPPVQQAFIPPPPVQPILSQPTGSVTSSPREVINDDAQSWNVHEYDAAKKKKKKSKGSLFVGNGMLCYGSETDKSLPVQQYPILDVTKYLYDGKNLHIEVEGSKSAILDFQASSKSEAKAILAKISDSAKAAQISNIHVNQQQQQQQQQPPTPDRQVAAPAAAIPPLTGSTRTDQQEEVAVEEESNCVPKWGISIYSFQAEGGDELSVEENEQIYVLDYERDDGWWRVQTVNGETGLVPSSYVQFDEGEDNNNGSDNNNVQDIRRQREEEELALQQQRIAEEKAREQQQKREQEERDKKRREEDERRRREEEDEKRRREEDRRREEEARRREEESRRKEEQRQAAEAAKRAEAARQRQIEEDYKRKETERKAQLARSNSSSKSKQDLPKPDTSKIRTWTDRSGSFKVEAQYIDFHNGKLRLHKLNGVKIDVPIEKMCAEDVRWVENRLKQHDEPEVTPAMPPRPQQSAPPPAPILPPGPTLAPAPVQPPQKKYNERWDWFDWFMVIGIPMQASLQYASAFKGDKLDDSDIPKLTHKQMKNLGIKEEHVQRIERYIETGQPEDLNEEQAEKKKKDQDQISKDEELARKLQKEWESSDATQSKAASTSNGRPRPSVSAPKDVHPDLLDFIGSQLGSDSGKGKEPEKPKGDLLGFNDDAWAPRSDNSPLAALMPTKATPSTSNIVAPIQPSGPTPEQIKAQEQIQAQEAERRRIQEEEEQIRKIQLLSLQQQTNEQKKQLEELQKLTQQQIDLQKQIAMQTGTQQQQHMLQMQAQQAQLQQAQLQQQLAPQFPQLQTSYTNTIPPSGFNAQPTGFSSQPTGFSSQPVGLNSQPTGFNNQPVGLNSQPTGFNNQSVGLNSQPTGFNNQPVGLNSQSTGFNNQPVGLNSQTTGFHSQLNSQSTGMNISNGRPRPTARSSLIQDPSLGQWQPNQQQAQPTGFQSQPTGLQSNALVPQQQQQQQNVWQGLQPQMTGIAPTSVYQQNSTLPPPLVPSTAGQQNVFNNNGLQRSHTIGAQPTGRHWNNSTPENPFGSPTISPLQAQMTGVQFNTPSPQAFNQSPLQNNHSNYMQPQMTGFQPQQPQGNSIFTPQGSMQYGQSAFPSQRPW